jgi:transposase
LYFKSTIRQNPAIGQLAAYYRLVESYRNLEGRICHRTLLNVGFMENVSVEQLNAIQAALNNLYHKQSAIFEQSDPLVKQYTDQFWKQLITSKKIDADWVDKATKQVDIESLQHSNVREIGAEWICYNTWNKLQLTEFLQKQGWSDTKIQLAATQIISRAVYPASELKTSSWIKENSAICEVTGYDMTQITKDKLYDSALQLYEVKDELEKHLSQRTNDLFDLEDKIILYDLTNTYFEGRKQNSSLAQFGRSKEKRKDAKLVVLAMVVNVEGFIKYTAIHEGNIADCNTLSAMIDKLATHSCSHKAVVVLDAGIATEENLELIQNKGYKYLCVSRTKLKNYTTVQNRLSVIMETKSKQQIRLKAVQTDSNTDYYLEVKSDAKAAKETGMKTQFEIRFEQQLQTIQKAINTKGGIKKANKVYERIGRAKEKYPSVHQYYTITVNVDEQTKQATGIQWHKDEQKHNAREEGLGIYFLRTNLSIKDEVVIWSIYNTIREIENSFRTLKSDLDLRPIYHKNDKSTMAHLHLGILAYWLVNTIRHQLKAKQINSNWSEIVRIANTQKVITTTGQNTYDKKVSIRKCSVPNKNHQRILDILQLKYQPFRKRKSVVHKTTLKILKPQYIQASLSG